MQICLLCLSIFGQVRLFIWPYSAATFSCIKTRNVSHFGILLWNFGSRGFSVSGTMLCSNPEILEFLGSFISIIRAIAMILCHLSLVYRHPGNKRLSKGVVALRQIPKSIIFCFYSRGVSK